ncbi:MAG: helix-turn-helix domain-containing protein [Lentisphaerae bacterium]|jgi:transcriptional regulator with XRE-family HTH domain|nr:helix-turn-helix domain-containing protein [Lentisphaerota bacterium]
MLRIRNRADSNATPQLPLSWDDNEQQPADDVTPTAPATPAEAPVAAQPTPPPKAADDADAGQNIPPVEPVPADDDRNGMTSTPEVDDTTPTKPLPNVVHLDEISDKLGLQLLSLRAKVGVSVAEVAAKVHAGVTYINDLEQGNYDRLPPDFFCKSLIERLCQEYDVDPEPLLELFEKESLMAGRMPSGFKETSADGFGIGKSRRDPLAVLTGSDIGSEADDEEKSPHRVIGLVLGLVVTALVILLVAAIVHQALLKRNPPPQQPAKNDLSVLITPQRPTPEVLRIQ